MNKLKEFQESHGLIADGVFGKKTAEKMMEVLGILTYEHLSHFLGQVAHETGDFNADTENLNYSKEGLMKTFPKYFTPLLATAYARKPEKIANRVYANRMGNGDEASGDGYRYRGRGALQLTGKDNYAAFAKFMMDPEILINPSIVATKYYFESAFWYFSKNKLWPLCIIVNDLSITKVSKAINLGNSSSTKTPNGLKDRMIKTKEYYLILTK